MYNRLFFYRKQLYYIIFYRTLKNLSVSDNLFRGINLLIDSDSYRFSQSI